MYTFLKHTRIIPLHTHRNCFNGHFPGKLGLTSYPPCFYLSTCILSGRAKWMQRLGRNTEGKMDYIVLYYIENNIKMKLIFE